MEFVLQFLYEHCKKDCVHVHNSEIRVFCSDDNSQHLKNLMAEKFPLLNAQIVVDPVNAQCELIVDVNEQDEWAKAQNCAKSNLSYFSSISSFCFFTLLSFFIKYVFF